jgi:preprotein translocase subunit SecE
VIPYRLFVWIRARQRERSPTQWPPHRRAFRWTLAVVELVALAALLPWAGQVVEVMTRVWGVEP